MKNVIDNYTYPFHKCLCVDCGCYFFCITPTWWCKSCNEKRQKSYAEPKESEGDNK